MPVQGHRHGTLRGCRTVAVADTVGLAWLWCIIAGSERGLPPAPPTDPYLPN